MEEPASLNSPRDCPVILHHIGLKVGFCSHHKRIWDRISYILSLQVDQQTSFWIVFRFRSDVDRVSDLDSICIRSSSFSNK